MPDPLQELLAAGAVPTTTFPPTSRYAAVGVEAWDPVGGRPPVPYLARRFCPRPETFAPLYEVRIVEGDRRDLLGALCELVPECVPPLRDYHPRARAMQHSE